jgi:hypothetical protein
MTTLLLDPPALSVTLPSLHQPSAAARLRAMRREYNEMPGLHLTRRQAERLWDLGPALCDALLGNLVAIGFLRRIAPDAFVRADWTARL